MKTIAQLILITLVTASVAVAADAPKVLGATSIVDGLTKKPEAKPTGLTRGLTRSISVAEKPQITTQAILFKFGTTDIEGDQSYAQIKELGKALSDTRLKNASIEIQGHTDNVGSDDYNKKLSEDRAKKIVQELQQHYELAVKNLVPVGKGKAEPVAGGKDKQSDAERAQNRRVVVQRLDPQP